MDASRILELIVRANDDASATLVKIGAELGALGDKATETSVKTGALTSDLEKSGPGIAGTLGMALPVVAGVGLALGVAAKSAGDFQQQMELVHTQAGASQQEVAALSKQVLSLAPAVGFGPTALAEALYHVESVGYRGADAMAVLKVSAQGAAVGQANLDDTTYALTSTMKSFNVEGVGEATKMMGELNAIVGAGDMKMQDLNGAIQTGILSTAQTFGIDIQSMGAALAYLTDRGEKADVASTRLSMGITLMAAPTEKAAKLLGDIGLAGPEVVASTSAMTTALRAAGLTTITLADDLKKPDGIQVALKDLQTHLTASGISADDAAALMARAFGGGRTDKALMALIENLTGVQQKYDAISDNAKNFAEDWASQQELANQKAKEFLAWLQAISIQLGEHVLVAAFATADAIASMWSRLMANPMVQQALNSISGALLSLAMVVRTQLDPELSKLWVQIGPSTTKALKDLAILFGVELYATVMLFIEALKITVGSMTLAVRGWEAFINMFKMAGVALTDFRNHWAEDIGFIIGYLATLPVKFGFYVSESIGKAVMELSSVNWGALFAGLIIKPWASAWNSAKDALTNLISWMLNIDWSSVGVSMGNSVGKAFKSALTGAVKGAVSGVPGAQTALHDLKIPGFATGGTNISGGLAWVGEQGPELINVPQGSNIYSTPQSQQMMAAGGGGDVNVTINVQNLLGNGGGVDQLATQIHQALMRVGRSNGIQVPSYGVRPS